MPNIRERLTDLTDRVETLRATLGETLFAIRDGSFKHWPEAPHTVAVEWHPRTETPPAGLTWCSDGERVWLVTSSGQPISPHAAAILFWTQALIPAPPRPPA